LAQHLAQDGYRIVEAPTPSTKRLRGRGKTDTLDALTAARSTLVTKMEHLRDRRSGQLHAALGVLTTAREQMRTDKVRSVNALTALLRTHALGLDARKALTTAQIKTVAAWRPRQEELGAATARAQAVRYAQRIGQLDQELKDNQQRLSALVSEQAPALLEMFGVGPATAATVLTVWSHTGRIRSEGAFAQIAGACPIPASSGNTIRHRLNRGGDRQLNQALHTIVLTRMSKDQATRDYVQRRIAQGRTKREIMRCLKRYVSRQIYRTLAADPPVALAA
ncbi:transposase, partial [Nocardiopsis xinjiangensis]|uniref:transposase n=1 Tax=Nocardiopsis xinjiangensis TaxID=124285 RepID=UPI0003675844